MEKFPNIFQQNLHCLSLMSVQSQLMQLVMCCIYHGHWEHPFSSTAPHRALKVHYKVLGKKCYSEEKAFMPKRTK